MEFTDEKVIDEITVLKNGIILYREATRIIKDNEQISQTYHRSSISPESDLTDVPNNVVEIANVAWTAEVIQAYKDSQDDNFNTKI
jgi:hypothetical protein